MRYADGEILHLLGIRKFEMCFKKLSENVDSCVYELKCDKFDCFNLCYHTVSSCNEIIWYYYKPYKKSFDIDIK